METNNAEATQKVKEIYRVNKACMDEVMDRISALIRGRSYSYKKDIAGENGSLFLNTDKLRTVIKEMLDNWEKQLCADTNIDTATGKSLAADYIEARRAMYEDYLFCVMSVVYETEKNVTYETVLDKAGELIAEWCVMRDDSGIYNDISYGIDSLDTFQYYGLLEGHPLSPQGLCPVDGRLEYMTNLGNKKRMDICVISPKPVSNPVKKDNEEAGNPVKKDNEEAEFSETDPYEIPDDREGVDVTLEDFGITAEEREIIDEYWQSEMQRRSDDETTAGYLPDGYSEACAGFYHSFRSADIITLGTFYEDLEQIVDRYLLSKNRTVLTDTDKCRKLYGTLYDSVLKQAKKYARGIEWENK